WLPTDSPATPYTVNYKAFEKLKSIPKPKILHGVGFPVGSCRPPDHRHITPLLESIDLVDAKWTSEHLAFNTAIGDSGTYSTRFFLPPQQTLTNAETIAANIRKICEKLSVPFAFENTVNYLRPRRGEIRDSNFIAEVAEKADCGILLDIHNLWTNERNGREAV
ncbi:MAG: DUF692 family protein, partial [Aliifodinibius sp.]|nr:DUF692 domain-containing protein [Phycisphaerae bacterium]NIR66338.1 DUF692 domain-containing protein [candidate division Zixibacteria bacterium]NIT59352.1 DUF692 domain-containing protein [Fodinibius sp.]NIS47431.1 DUF692 domain-containing protein [candidate division Zixibacteria bacterium]NIU16045.1 DUF692 domain-containing protein [candidate division Zixibacteria bacterium]